MKGTKNMINTKAFSLLLVAVIVSFMGFCIENIFIGINHGFIDNRNMILPFLFGYGLTILAIYSLFGTPSTPLYFGKPITFESNFLSTLFYFSVAFLGVCIGEILLGFATEYSCKIIWWDYTRIPLHITRYTSVPTSLGFASLITIFMKYLFDPLINTISKMTPKILFTLTFTLVTLLSADMINSAMYMLINNQTLKIWRVNLDSMSVKIFSYFK